MAVAGIGHGDRFADRDAAARNELLARISDDLGTAFDSAELLVTLNGVTSASSLSATNFIDFQAT